MAEQKKSLPIKIIDLTKLMWERWNKKQSQNKKNLN